MLNVSTAAVGLACLATGLGGLLGGALNARLVSLAGLGAIASALSASASTKEALGQDRRNQERFAKALDALEELTGKLDEIRTAAANNEREPLRQFVAAVHEQMSLEHRQWLGAAESTKDSIAKLDESLAATRSRLTGPKPPTPSAAPKAQTGV